MTTQKNSFLVINYQDREYEEFDSLEEAQEYLDNCDYSNEEDFAVFKVGCLETMNLEEETKLTIQE